jgi:N-acyl homoserine lactone hydrolase
VGIQEGTCALVRDIVRKVDVNVDREIPPGLFYNLESTRRAIIDIKRRADRILPAHDPAIAASLFPAYSTKTAAT